MQFKIFISSVQREFADERKLLHRRHRSIPVNPLLARGMFYRGYIEKVGSGTGDMLEKCRLAGTPEPEWIEEDDGFTVVLKRREVSVVSGGQKSSRNDLDHDLDDLEMKILNLVGENSLMTYAKLAKSCKCSVPTIQRRLGVLQRCGRLRRVGPDKGGHWEVISPSA